MKTASRIITFRVTEEEGRQLERLVAQANKLAKKNGLPEEVTVSSLLRQWIKNQIEPEVQGTIRPDTKIVQVKANSTLSKARAKLRDSRESKEKL